MFQYRIRKEEKSRSYHKVTFCVSKKKALNSKLNSDGIITYKEDN